MTAKQIIHELFDRQADHIETEYAGQDEYAYRIYAGGYVYRLGMQSFNTNSPGAWDVQFVLLGSEEEEDRRGGFDDTHGTFDIAKTGQQFVIFPVVLGILRKWAARAKPRVVQFVAKEPSRIKLYRSMAARFAPELGMQVEELPNSTGSMRFVLRRA